MHLTGLVSFAPAMKSAESRTEWSDIRKQCAPMRELYQPHQSFRCSLTPEVPTHARHWPRGLEPQRSGLTRIPRFQRGCPLHLLRFGSAAVVCDMPSAVLVQG